MKHTLSVILAVAIVLASSVSAFADPSSTTKDITLFLGVNDSFGFEVWDSELNQILDNVNPGETGFADIHIYATSNHSIPWAINASSTGLDGLYDPSPETLPVKMATFDGAGAGLTGTLVDGLVLTGVAQPIYTAGTGEYPVLGLQISALCIIETDVGTKTDAYQGIVTLTMTE